MKISIAKIQKPRARLIKLTPVEILCRACRLITQSGVSTFDSDARANLRLKLAVASIRFSLFLIGGRNGLFLSPHPPAVLTNSNEKSAAIPQKKHFTIPKSFKRIFQRQTLLAR
jgi:hypothetical protein